MPLRLAIGTSDFRKLRESGAYYAKQVGLQQDGEHTVHGAGRWTGDGAAG